MGRPWAELSSAERKDAILLAVSRLRYGDAFGNAIAYEVAREHPMQNPRHGNHSAGNVARAMALATRVTPGITALRRDGLLTFVTRRDGLTGSCDVLTAAGRERVEVILDERRG